MSPTDLKTIMNKVKEAFGEKCALCGIKQKQYPTVQLVVHYIDRHHHNLSKENLIVFCRRCHPKVDNEARYYYLCRERQLEMFPETDDYLETMKKLWFAGLQRDLFEDLLAESPSPPLLSEPGARNSFFQLNLPTL